MAICEEPSQPTVREENGGVWFADRAAWQVHESQKRTATGLQANPESALKDHGKEMPV